MLQRKLPEVWYQNGTSVIITVASGKGGTGKTLVATSLALSLTERTKVQLLDCDVEEPNAHLLLSPVIVGSEAVSIPVPEVDRGKCNYCGKCAEVCAYNAIAVVPGYVLTFPELCHGCGACSYLCPEEAITEVGREVGVVEWGDADGIKFVQGRLNVGEPLAPPVIRQVKQLANREGVVIVDASPGTSCPVVEAVKGCDFCLLVTEPTPFGLNDLALSVEMVRELGLPCGVVVNRAGIGNGEIEDYCKQNNIPVLLTIPLDIEIARLYSKGVPLVAGLPEWSGHFLKLFSQIGGIVRERAGGIKR